jgi:hypothetical protein
MAISSVTYKSTSPYYSTDYLDNKFLDIMNNRSIPALANDKYITITPTYQYRPDLLSYDLYKRSDYWWVFAARNKDKIIDPIWDFTVGKGIYVPSELTLRDALGA